MLQQFNKCTCETHHFLITCDSEYTNVSEQYGSLLLPCMNENKHQLRYQLMRLNNAVINSPGLNYMMHRIHLKEAQFISVSPIRVKTKETTDINSCQNKLFSRCTCETHCVLITYNTEYTNVQQQHGSLVVLLYEKKQKPPQTLIPARINMLQLFSKCTCETLLCLNHQLPTINVPLHKSTCLWLTA